MINLRELPLWILMVFTAIYATVGNPDSEIWSGAYFLVNYTTMLLLFKQHKSKNVRIIGISLSLSILVFVALKYIFKLDLGRGYTFIPFVICLIGLIIIDRKKNASNNRKTL